MNIFKKLIHLESNASAFGFRWESAEQILAQIQSECAEINELLPPSEERNLFKLEEEIGDLLHAVFSLCLFCQFDPKSTLAAALNKFEKRLQEVKQIAHEQGLVSLQGKASEELLSIWTKAKARAGCSD
ncbi:MULTISPECIES: MazG nucleotide pyrophosphohydrolase domain-containing protein [Legionella]|uniref:Nucleoside triphosphate hydrolase n=1 Tax=Legionella septentrionalis TaxID=2498109 RepID=A0A433JHZ9_9GAMM|nr:MULTISPECIES: MazG nucleotide pyrophosphohydrolase domain-containing protein [Legionella]MCP0912963.1 nucleoside triphosphate hydrolase [Legionella sp. 27cVA30]RUQ84506.1 nucleoside triphosphate hydrolase [Legionella septentrionalis]RUQ96745.1 nucleoside triphosphate hydrolase [Legionella septentrionalis]RUR10150.1 nucleoside triphosphate hydrolase [Legionella septentrionalis]RUR15458.1 nucleoside triphosphate hydrolase [Legionella septentrionalis]